MRLGTLSAPVIAVSNLDICAVVWVARRVIGSIKQPTHVKRGRYWYETKESQRLLEGKIVQIDRYDIPDEELHYHFDPPFPLRTLHSFHYADGSSNKFEVATTSTESVPRRTASAAALRLPYAAAMDDILIVPLGSTK